MTDDFYKKPLDYNRLCEAVQCLSRHQRALKVFSIGESVLGRKLYAFGLGEPQGATLFVGGVHGMEWLTSMLMLRLSEDLVRALENGCPLADIDIGRSLENRSLVVLPCLNPDGTEISLHGSGAAGEYEALVEKTAGGDTCRWQANTRGVDLNHNFDAGFNQLREMEKAAGIFGPGPTQYGGPCPESEPETRAIVRFCETFQPRQVLAFHSQGEEIYYKYGSCTPVRSQLMAQVMASASGYRLARPEGLASHGGFKDWFILHTGRPGFTIEIGRGRNPLPVEELDPIYARLLEMMLIAILL